jgi:phage major head subunit gpT-like protein
MLINASNLRTLYDAFNASFKKGFDGAPTRYKDIAMVVGSAASSETYGWLGQFPKLREWLGDRIVKNLSAHTYTIQNKKFESTISVARTHIEDDRYGVFAPVLTETGKAAAEMPDELIFGLLAAGFTTACYDGQFFFDTDHPVKDAAGNITNVSNVQAGSGPAWYLLDTSRAIKPMVYQERIPFRLQALDQDGDDNVFWRDEYIYGVRGRSNAGFGLWQLAYASKAALTPANYEAARAAMMNLNGDEGRPLGLVPDTLVAPPSLEGDAMRLLNNGTRIEIVGTPPNDQPVAIQNEWAGTAKPIVTAWAR